MTQKRLNFLLRVQRVVEEYEHWKRPEASITGVWREHIYPQFHISLPTLRQYLEINFKKELKAYHEKFNTNS